jgi:hypothetical protein
MAVKATLLDLLERAYQEKCDFIDQLPEDERAVVGTRDQWSAKDLMAHIVAWDARMMDNLDLIRRGETPPSVDDIHDENAAIFDAHRDTSWDELRRMAGDAHTRIAGFVRATAEDDLVDPQRSPWQDDRPAWQRVAGTAVTHSLLHLAEYHTQHNQTDHATRLQDETARLLLTLDESPNWQGITIYNLACYYAIAGQKATAITKLAEALRLNPGLTDWSKEDPDFRSIREEPGYQALYT